MSRNFTIIFEIVLLFYHYFESAYIFSLTFLYILCFLHCHGDIELNPGPKKLKQNTFPICHWNLNSITAHNFSKLTQFWRIFQLTNMISYVCLKRNLIDIKGYNFIHADLPDNI